MMIVLVLAVNLIKQFKSPEVPVLNSNMINEHQSRIFFYTLLLYSLSIITVSGLLLRVCNKIKYSYLSTKTYVVGAPKTYVKLMGKTILTVLLSKNVFMGVKDLVCHAELNDMSYNKCFFFCNYYQIRH